MKQSPVSAPAVAGERHAVACRLAAFLRERHPIKTAEHVSAATDLSPATVASLLERGSAPSAMTLLALVGAYGAEGLAALWEQPPAWLIAAARQAERDRIEAQIDALRGRLEQVAP